MPDGENPHRLELEAHGKDIPHLKDFLERIELGSNLTRFRIEIDAESPIITDRTKVIGDSAESEPDPEPESKEESEEKTKEIEDYEECQTKVLSHNNGDTKGIDTINIGTNRWKVTAFLYRQNEGLRLIEIEEYLKNTPWEVKYKSISATLSKLKGENIVRVDKDKNRNSRYTLTEKGEKMVAKTVEKADNYPLTTADKISGLHPTHNYEQPDFEQLGA